MWGEVLKTHEIFKEFLSKIANEVSPIVYSTWFNDLKLISMDDKEIVIQVPLAVHKQILKTNYFDLIDEIMFSLTNKNYEYNFLTSDELDIIDNTIKEEVVETKEMTESWISNLNPNLNFDNYVVGESNRLAFISAMNVAQSPGTIRNPLFIYGRSGVGKTHLMHAIGNYIESHSNYIQQVVNLEMNIQVFLKLKKVQWLWNMLIISKINIVMLMF